MFTKLVKIANELDQRGLYAEADALDSIIKTAVSQSTLIRSLKNDDQESTMRALTEFISSLPSHTSPDKELGMTRQKFQEFADSIKGGDLDKARELYGVGKDVKLDPSMYSPITGQPWPSNLKSELQFVKDTLGSVFEIKEVSLETVPNKGIATVSWPMSVHYLREAVDITDRFESHGYAYDDFVNRDTQTRDELLTKKIDDSTEIIVKLHSGIDEPSDWNEDWSWVYVTVNSSDVNASTAVLKKMFGV